MGFRLLRILTGPHLKFKFNRGILGVSGLRVRSPKQTEELTHDEFEIYKEIGLRMTLQGRYQRNIGRSDRAESEQQESLAAAATITTLQILESSQTALVLQGETLEQRFDAFQALMKAERKESLAKRKALAKPEDPTEDAAADVTLVRALGRYGGNAHANGLRKAPIATSSVVEYMQWRIPIVPFIKVRLC